MNGTPITPYNRVSTLLAQAGQLSRVSVAPTVPAQRQPLSAPPLALQAPSQLFARSALTLRSPAQIPAISSHFQLSSNSPRQQLMQLGQKYGVPYNHESLDRYQKKVIKTIIRFKARELGIPEAIALGIAGNESGWKMWKNPDAESGADRLMAGRNVRNGELRSTDWGVMQINDKAHPRAFPRVKQDLEYNIEYGLNYLARQRRRIKGHLNLGLGDWDRTVASYNLGHNPKTERAHQIARRYVGHVSRRAAQFA